MNSNSSTYGGSTRNGPRSPPLRLVSPLLPSSPRARDKDCSSRTDLDFGAGKFLRPLPSQQDRVPASAFKGSCGGVEKQCHCLTCVLHQPGVDSHRHHHHRDHLQRHERVRTSSCSALPRSLVMTAVGAQGLGTAQGLAVRQGNLCFAEARVQIPHALLAMKQLPFEGCAGNKGKAQK